MKTLLPTLGANALLLLVITCATYAQKEKTYVVPTVVTAHLRP